MEVLYCKLEIFLPESHLEPVRQALARVDAGSDAKSIALSSESAAYVLGVSEIRRVQAS